MGQGPGGAGAGVWGGPAAAGSATGIAGAAAAGYRFVLVTDWCRLRIYGVGCKLRRPGDGPAWARLLSVAFSWGLGLGEVIGGRLRGG
jgi:hypothetical protein